MSQRIETREVFHLFGGHPILCVTDFSDTVEAVLNSRATEINRRILHLYEGAVGVVVQVVGASRARPPRHLAQPPGLLASSSAPAGRTPGTA
jgi:hypothetical protein